jgi:hypothetical protein
MVSKRSETNLFVPWLINVNNPLEKASGGRGFDLRIYGNSDNEERLQPALYVTDQLANLKRVGTVCVRV